MLKFIKEAEAQKDEQELESANLSDELGTLMAQAAGERSDTSEDLDFRKRAYTLLEGTADKIHGASQYVFWLDPESRQHYVCMYQRENRGRSGSRSGSQSAVAVE